MLSQQITTPHYPKQCLDYSRARVTMIIAARFRAGTLPPVRAPVASTAVARWKAVMYYLPVLIKAMISRHELSPSWRCRSRRLHRPHHALR